MGYLTEPTVHIRGMRHAHDQCSPRTSSLHYQHDQLQFRMTTCTNAFATLFFFLFSRWFRGICGHTSTLRGCVSPCYLSLRPSPYLLPVWHGIPDDRLFLEPAQISRLMRPGWRGSLTWWNKTRLAGLGRRILKDWRSSLFSCFERFYRLTR